MAKSINLVFKTPDDSTAEAAEQRLWQAFREGDQGAFSRIYERYARKLLSYGRKMTLDEQRIEDAIQDLFIELWKSRESLSPTTSIQFYLIRALRNKLSRHRAGPPFSKADEEESLSHQNLLSPPFEAAWISQEEETAQVASLQRAIDQLSGRQREVIHLRYYQHFDGRQIAELMGINDQSVRNLLHTALRSLKQSLVGGILHLIVVLFTP